MQKIKMSRGTLLTFEEGCNKYLENCRQRNLREGTINHYRQSYLYFYKYFDPKMPIEDIDEQTYKDYVLHLKSTLDIHLHAASEVPASVQFPLVSGGVIVLSALVSVFLFKERISKMEWIAIGGAFASTVLFAF